MKKTIFLLLFFIFSCSLWSQDTITNKNDEQKEQLSFDKDSKLHGKCYAWNSEGVLIGEASYKHGLKHGVWLIYYDNGTLAYQMDYTNGQKTGEWKSYSKEGKLLTTKKFTE